jgi:beta-lactam-binding protein with PASTA domain
MNRAFVGVALVGSVLLGGCTSGSAHSPSMTAKATDTASTPTASPTHEPHMPRVLEMNYEAARAVLVAAGITAGRITLISGLPFPLRPRGSVTSQHPVPGTSISAATTVNLLLAG